MTLPCSRESLNHCSSLPASRTTHRNINSTTTAEADPAIITDRVHEQVPEDGVQVITAVHKDGVQAGVVGGAVGGAGRQAASTQPAGYQRPRVAHVVLEEEAVKIRKVQCD